ncbi:MAG: PCRF domain-containing protein, partial [Pseudomonadota bacterium]|nr:PCRF domain-containing protein [Pseudomonadota bacterium]
MVPVDKLDQITNRFEFLEASLAQGGVEDFAKISREYAELKPVAEQIAAYRTSLDDLAEAEAMLSDPEMRDLAEEEIPALRARIPEMEHALQLALLPKDAADARPAILEIRPGTGGEEAALFAGDLLRMYQRYCEGRGWKFEVLEETQTELGGIKEVVANIQGDNVFARMKFE